MSRLVLCKIGVQPPENVTHRVCRCPVGGCRGRLKADFRPSVAGPVRLRCLTCGLHFEILNPHSFYPQEKA